MPLKNVSAPCVEVRRAQPIVRRKLDHQTSHKFARLEVPEADFGVVASSGEQPRVQRVRHYHIRRLVMRPQHVQ